jgi:ubiquinone/menaquinone biosynthesis C-methylase UbiE
MPNDHRSRILDQFTRQAVPFSIAAPIRNEEALQRLVRIADAGPDDTVLDVACGPGLLACAFAPVVRHVTGIDVTPAMIEQALTLQQAKGIANITWDLADVPPLPYADGQFTIVTCRFSFHHMLDPLGVLLEMRRVCARGGRLVVADLTPEPAHADAFNAAERLRDPSHVRAMPPAELLDLFARAGFTTLYHEAYRLDGELEDLLSRSFPEPGDADRLRRIYADSLADDALGIQLRRDGDRLRFAFPNTVVAATNDSSGTFSSNRMTGTIV